MPRATPAILHVCESYAGGVRAAIMDYVSAVPEAEHHLLYSTRADAPINVEDLTVYSSVEKMPTGHTQRVRAIREAVAGREFTAVHAHSSFAGAYTRAAIRRGRARIVYTPHCYAFERRDLSRAARQVYHTLEHVMAMNTTVVAACSPRELRLSHWKAASPDVRLLPNIAPSGIEQFAGARSEFDSSSPLHLVAGGRASKQKDPSFYFACVKAARDAGIDVDATWIGGNDELAREAADYGVTVTGWLAREKNLRMVSAADLYVHTAAWEGFPVAVLESVAMGVPTLVRAIPAFEGTDVPRFTSPSAFVDKLRNLKSEADLKALLAQGAQLLDQFNAGAQRQALLEIYEIA